ncbi:glycosyltransferase family 4 protein [Microbacterium oxydans]|uniref:glycosyltransferase family 4 protein n=1 Tax=Microbacterium sp. B19(2022) TaxID=2914045 RepID=UPI00143124DD|nr:glycosyltransferase family 4 protein [Microbacterium sp. B19(2022)]NJI60701.1 glycosyltransferase family 4 protein [Microbacterium sp. B19(2022)]
MRIVYLHQYFNTPAQSGSTRSYEFARRLAGRGHDVHMITSDRDTRGDERGWTVTPMEGFHVHSKRVAYDNSMTPLQRIRAFATFALSSARLARQLRADVIYATSTPLTIFLPAWYAAAGRKTPIVFEVRDSWPTVPIALGYLSNPIAQRLARALERKAYRRSAHVVTLSPGMAEDAITHGADPDEITVIPNAADVELFDVDPALGRAWRKSNAIAADAPLIVYTGTFGAANEVEFLVEVAGEAVKIDPRVTFVLIGNGARFEAVRNRAQKLGLLGGCVRILPPVSKAEIPSVLSAADITTSVVTDNPVMNANSANKFFDSLAAGRAIAINHEGWQAVLIRGHQIGLVLDRTDIPGSAARLVAFAGDETVRRSAHRKARVLAREQFLRDDLASRLADTLEAVDARR